MELLLEERAYLIRECLVEFNGDHGLAARYLLRQLDEWAQGLTVRHPDLLLGGPNAHRPILDTIKAARRFVAEHILLPEKHFIKQFVIESELLSGNVLKTTLKTSWDLFCNEAKIVNLQSPLDSLWLELSGSSFRGYSRTDEVVFRCISPRIEAYLFALKELVDLGEFLHKDAVTGLLELFLMFVHSAGVERYFPMSPGAWADMANKRFRRLRHNELEIERRKKDAIFDSTFFFSAGKDLEFLLQRPRLDADMYNERGACIIDVKDTYSRVILYAFTNLLIDIVLVKTGQIPDGKIRTILIQAMRSVSAVAEMGAMEAARAKQQEKAKKGARTNKQKSDQALKWVASAAQVLLNAYPFMSDSDIAAVLSSAEKRANIAELLSDPAAQAILRQATEWRGKHRTIRDKLKQARALGRIVSPQGTGLQPAGKIAR